MASDRSHELTGIGRRLPLFVVGLAALLDPAVAGSAFEASSILTMALVALAVALTIRVGHAASPHVVCVAARAREAGKASYAVHQSTDPQRSPRRPRAPEQV